MPRVRGEVQVPRKQLKAVILDEPAVYSELLASLSVKVVKETPLPFFAHSPTFTHFATQVVCTQSKTTRSPSQQKTSKGGQKALNHAPSPDGDVFVARVNLRLKSSGCAYAYRLQPERSRITI